MLPRMVALGGWPVELVGCQGRLSGGGQAGGSSDGQGSRGSHPDPWPAPVGEQDQRRDDLDPVYRERERAGMPAGVVVRRGELAHGHS